ncbi:MAG: DUF1330 domain-containing protein [Methylophilaceae bacterium]
MSAYVVMIREHTLDQGEMSVYAQLAKLAREGHNATPLVNYGDLEILEGPEVEGCFIQRFQTTKDAQNWYQSPKYQEAAKHRYKGAQYRVLIVEGIYE